MAGTAGHHTALAEGRAALSRGAWQDARASFERALADGEPPAALEGLSWAAWWSEDVPACLDARERAYRGYRQAGDLRGAARMALWLGDDHVEFLGAHAVAEGWFGRAARLLEDLEPCPEHGWLAAFEAHAHLGRHELDDALRLAAQAREAGRRHGAVDLEMFALATEGVVRVEQGDVVVGMRCLDEATAAALGGEYENLAPAAWSCCLLISSCEQVRDYERGAQWCRKVEEFSRRVDARFVTGVCRAHYGAILAWHGDWDDAERELVGALDDLTTKRPHWRAEAVVRLGDLRRRQGRYGEATELLEQAPAHPLAQRGMAALRMDRGEHAGARDLLQRALRQVPPRRKASRAEALELLVRAEVALGELPEANAHLGELRDIAEALATEPLRAATCRCAGLLATARGEHDEACDRLEDAIDGFARSDAPFEAARTRVDLARCLLAMDRAEAAVREARLALGELERFGAPAEAAQARALLERCNGEAASGPEGQPLTARQVEVLRLVADGLPNQEIARRLVLSEHTVHRHVANIYVRLGCSSRAAAVAQAARMGLL